MQPSVLPEWAQDAPDIAGNVRLLRRVHSCQLQPSALAPIGFDRSTFRENEPGAGLSMTVWESDADVEDVLRFNEGMGVVAIEAHHIRRENGLIVRAPLVGNLNHCEIYPRFGKGPCGRLRDACRWVRYPMAPDTSNLPPLVTLQDPM
jgi:hypothetical protein